MNKALSALAAQAELHHPLLLRQEPGVATREGPQVVGDWRFRLFRLFRELNKRLGTTILIATHDMALVRKAKSDVLRLADGMVMRVPASALAAKEEPA